MIRYFEKVVEIRANTMLKYKRLFAWLFFFSFLLTTAKICIKLYKVWDEHFQHGVGALLRERAEKKRGENGADIQPTGTEARDQA